MLVWSIDFEIFVKKKIPRILFQKTLFLNFFSQKKFFDTFYTYVPNFTKLHQLVRKIIKKPEKNNFLCKKIFFCHFHCFCHKKRTDDQKKISKICTCSGGNSTSTDIQHDT